MREIHTSNPDGPVIGYADLHTSRERIRKVTASVKAITDKAKEVAPAFFVNAGDFDDGPIQNTKASGMPQRMDLVADQIAIAPVISIEGTLTHDIPGALDSFTRMKGTHQFIVLSPGEVVKIGSYVVSGYPEASKSWVQAGSVDMSLTELNAVTNEAMADMFRGVAAAWKDRTEKKVFIYHGEVIGSVFQNGRQRKESSKIAVRIEDLAATGADIIILGHIHLKQKLPGVNAYYPGPAYPEWGELGVGGFYVWRKDEPEWFPYPHNEKVKLTLDRDEYDRLFENPMNFSGKDVWLHLVGEKDWIRSIPRRICEEKLKAAGAGIVRITTEPVSSEMARAKEITEDRRLGGKLKIWAEKTERGILPQSVYDKALMIEEHFDRDAGGYYPQQFRIDWVSARGLIGIWKGIGKEEVFLDFSNFESGILGLFDENGRGKSTLIKNCHFYPNMLKTGSLKKDFYLKDSHRKIQATDVINGIVYKAELLIDGFNESGSVNAMLFSRAVEEEDWKPISNGRLRSNPVQEDDYISMVNTIFGPQELFVRSAFIMQPGVAGSESIITALPSEKKMLFNELLGNSYLEDYSDWSKVQADNAVEQIAEVAPKIQVTEESIAKEEIGYDERLTSLREAGRILAEKKETAEEDAQQKKSLVLTAEDGERKYQLALAKKDDTAGSLQTEVARKEGLEAQLAETKSRLEKIDSYKAKKAEKSQKEAKLSEAKKTIQDADTKFLQEKNSVMTANAEIEKKINVLRDEYRSIEKAHSEKMALARKDHQEESTRVEKNRSDKRQKITELKSVKSNAETKVEALREKADSLASSGTCPTCQQPLPAEKLAELKAQESAVRTQIADQEKIVSSAEIEIQAEELALTMIPPAKDFVEDPKPANLEEITTKAAELEASKTKEPDRDNTDLEKMLVDSIEKELKEYPEDLDKVLEDRDRDVASIKTLEYEVEDARKKVAKLEEDAKKIEGEILILKGEHDRHEEAKKALEEALGALAEVVKQIAENNAAVKHCEAEMEKIKARRDDLDRMKSEVAPKQTMADEWRLLQEACGRNGIQALELDALAPSVSDEANRIVAGSYGDRYQIEIRTQKSVGKGKNSKEVEDFDIWVYDSQETNERLVWQQLSTNSGGEAVWLVKAIYDAFGIVREHNTGKKWLTVFQDEMDGALSHEKKAIFMRMVEASHQESGRAHTVLISHDRGIQEMLPENQQTTVESLAD